MRLRSCLPVAGAAAVVSDGNHNDLILSHTINDAEWKASGQDSPGTCVVGTAGFWMLPNLPSYTPDLGYQVIPEIRRSFIVVLDGSLQLTLCSRMKADRQQIDARGRLCSCAKASSAERSSTAPESISAMRRSISSAQARSTTARSSEASSSRLARRRWMSSAR